MEHVEVAAKRDKKGEEARKERKREEKVKVGEEVKEGGCAAERNGG